VPPPFAPAPPITRLFRVHPPASDRLKPRLRGPSPRIRPEKTSWYRITLQPARSVADYAIFVATFSAVVDCELPRRLKRIDKTSPMFAWERVVRSPQLGAPQLFFDFLAIPLTPRPLSWANAFNQSHVPWTPLTLTLFLLVVTSDPYGEFAHWLARSWAVDSSNHPWVSRAHN